MERRPPNPVPVPTQLVINIQIGPETRALILQVLQAIQGATNSKLDVILNAVQTIGEHMTLLEDKVSSLETSLTGLTDVVTGAETLLGTLNQLLRDAIAGGGNVDAVVARVQTVIDTVEAKKSELAAAVAANTPAAPEPGNV